MNQELTIHHLGRRLGKGLIGEVQGDFKANVELSTHYWNEDNNTSVKWGINDFLVKGVKPYLFPLSSLTKEIEIGGKKFIPILEMFQIAYKSIFDHDWKVSDPIAYYNEPQFPSIECMEIIEGKPFRYGFSLELPSRTCMSVNGDEMTIPQFEIIDKIIEWNFWKGEPKGSYIEVTPDNNPYK